MSAVFRAALATAAVSIAVLCVVVTQRVGAAAALPVTLGAPLVFPLPAPFAPLPAPLRLSPLTTT